MRRHLDTILPLSRPRFARPPSPQRGEGKAVHPSLPTYRYIAGVTAGAGIKFWKRAAFGVAAAVGLGVPAAAQVVQTPLDALAQDAGEYAARYGVPLDEAMRRLRAQEESVTATNAIAQRFADRLTGIAIEHTPNYRIVVLLKGDAPVPEERLFVGGMVVPVMYRIGAAATRGEVVAAIERSQTALRAELPHAPSLGLDQRTGEMVVTVDQDDVELYGRDALLTDLTLNIGVPVRLRTVDRVANLSIEGGARVVGISNADGDRKSVV